MRRGNSKSYLNHYPFVEPVDPPSINTKPLSRYRDLVVAINTLTQAGQSVLSGDRVVKNKRILLPNCISIRPSYSPWPDLEIRSGNLPLNIQRALDFPRRRRGKPLRCRFASRAQEFIRKISGIMESFGPLLVLLCQLPSGQR